MLTGVSDIMGLVNCANTLEWKRQRENLNLNKIMRNYAKLTNEE